MESKPGTRAIGYTRVSTGEQSESGLGLAAQEMTIRRAVEYKGWTLIDVVRDGGSSGKDLARPALRQALERLAAREADALVVAKLDRLTRSTVDLLGLLEWSDACGISLIALDLDLDTSTANGKLMASILGSVVEWERSVIALRTREAAAVRRRDGLSLGRPGVRDSNPELADHIQSTRAKGRTWQGIADELNATGVPTIRGGTCWRVSSVQAAAGYRRPAPRRRQADLPAVPRRRKQTDPK
jgi:DNA invertase Pin-like site-specific DNA recombinase